MPENFLQVALKSIPEAAINPLAFLAYIIAVIAGGLLAKRQWRLSAIMKRIEHIPPNDRLKLLQHEMNTILPPKISADEWIRSERQRLYFYGFSILLLVCLCVVGISAWLVTQRSKPEAAAIKGITFMIRKTQ